MRQHTYSYLIGLVLAGTTLYHPTKSLGHDSFLETTNPASSAAQPDTWRVPTELADQSDLAEPLDTAGVDYCYKGSVIDPTTGEVVDLYALCTEDETEQDLA
jgi:hypothetical protein